MPATKDGLEKHMYEKHGAYPGSLVNASVEALKDWHRHQHRVHEPVYGGVKSDYGAIPKVDDPQHNNAVPTLANHAHGHAGGLGGQ